MGYVVTEKGTVTIPAEVRRRYNLRKGSRVEFVETDEGILIVPVVPLEELYGVDGKIREKVYGIVKELHEERRKEAAGEK
ncbi:MAG: AbrB/MazE/SpoVT family DNA-binding domain-containing protein [Candidatus Bathyarchaeia archaeon]